MRIYQIWRGSILNSLVVDAFCSLRGLQPFNKHALVRHGAFLFLCALLTLYPSHSRIILANGTDIQVPSDSTSADMNTQYNCVSVTEIPEAECDALVAFYRDNDGPNWNSSNWLTTQTPCGWSGVVCSGKHVVKLEINQNLTRIPDELEILHKLTVLDLSNNQLTAIPNELGTLTNLQNLDLSQNQLTVIPSNMGNLEDLVDLDLSENQLPAIPDDLGNLSKLRRLDLRNNQLTNIPNEVGNLTKLKKLQLTGNRLTDISDARLENLVLLEELEVANNQLTEIPTDVGTMAELERLDASNNQIVKLPDSKLIGLASLIELNLANNTLSRLADEISTLTKLEILVLSDNQLVSLPDSSLGSMATLKELHLAGNQLVRIPDEFANLSSLQALDMSRNRLTFAADEVGMMLTLRELDISDNPSLAGDVPLTYANLNLTRFDFTNTALCEPAEPLFQDWLTTISSLHSTHRTCNTQSINFATGSPGSFFIVRGKRFPPSTMVKVSVNFHELTSIQVNGSGAYTFTLSTDNTEPGEYLVTTDMGDGAPARFTIDLDAITRTQKYDAIVLDIPPGISLSSIYMPIAGKQ